MSVISERAFAFCSSLKYAVISAESLTVEDEAFFSCRALDTLLVKNNGGATVSDSAFKDAKIQFAGAIVNENEDAEANLTVKYVYEDGSEAAETVVKPVKFGKTESVVSPAVEGYTPDRLTVTETLYGKDLEVSVTYKKNETPAETSETTTAPADKDEKSKSPVTLILTIVLFAAVVAGIVFLAISYSKSGKNDGKKASKSNKNTSSKKK